MSSKLNVKAKGKDGRPKSSDRLRKKRDGTPEKSLTPSLEPDDSQTPTRNVIWNEEIQKLQIRQDDLPKAWPPRPPSIERQAPSPVKVSVKKAKKILDADKPKSRVVSVAKPAPPDAPVKEPDYSGYAGPRYDNDGKVVMHSLLGTYEDFHREATKRGDLALDVPDLANNPNLGGRPTVKYEKKKRSRELRSHRDENRALEHWQRRMMERKRQQGYISDLIQKAPEDLAMNQGDNYRNVQERRYLIDRAIPKIDYGKGYRVGSEFWQQQEPFGDDLTGLHMSLSQSQRGYPAPLERIGLSKAVKAEKGSERSRPNNTTLHYPWHKSDFLNKRQQELQPFMDEISDNKPDFDNLQVIGSNVPFFRTMEEGEEKKDVMKAAGEEEDEGGEEDCEVQTLMEVHGDETTVGEEVEKRNEQEDLDGQEKPVFGPSLLFGGQRARWMGDSFFLKNEVGIEARVTFEALTGDRVTSYLELSNNGTTSIYYDWKKTSQENPFQLIQAQVQRFYFNNSSGVLLPGETLKFPFVFKSPNAGVFTEQWILETRPVVCAGAALVVTLRGVAIQEDKFKKQREQLENQLVHRQANQVVHHLLYELVSGVRTPVRARSPVDTYITEEEIFNRNNPGLLYNHELVTQLKQLHQQLFEDQEDSYANVWGLSIQDLQQCILEMEDEDDAKKENYLHQMNDVVKRLSNIPHAPVTQRLEAVGHQLFAEAVDSIVGEAMYLRTQMGLPNKELDEVDGDASDSRKGGRAPDKGKAEPAKDKGKAAGGKEGKGGKGKEAKADAKGKTTPGPKKAATPVKAAPTPAPTSSSLGMASATAGGAGGGGGDKDAMESFSSQPSSPEPGHTISDIDLAATEKLYRDTLMSQAYNILGEMIDQMDKLFSATKDADNGLSNSC